MKQKQDQYSFQYTTVLDEVEGFDDGQEHVIITSPYPNHGNKLMCVTSPRPYQSMI